MRDLFLHRIVSLLTLQSRNRAMAGSTLLIASCLVSCASARTQVALTSIPAGAEIRLFDGEKVGKTPLVLEKDRLESATKTGRLTVLITAPGYLERELVLEVRGKESYQVRLTRLDSDYFSKHILTDFSAESNVLARDLMKAQGLVLAAKLDEAEKFLREFQERFPNIAASYVLLASVESQRGRREQARQYLLRARDVDPTDPVVIRMLGLSPGAPP